MKIAVAGLGYVGLSNAVLLARDHDVVGYDIDAVRIGLINARESPFQDSALSERLSGAELRLKVTENAREAFQNADVVIIATPTNFDETRNGFATETVEETIALALEYSERAVLVVRSTVPVGFTEKMQKRFATEQILFCPEFLREGQALHDSLHPSRIIVGGAGKRAKDFASILADAAEKQDVETLLMSPSEAEAVKLFSNSYLAMRVAFFNELDSYALSHELDARNIINGIGFDPRIGNHHNNPSFGYGGYCLPKDARQLLSNFDFVPQSLISAIIEANQTRKTFIANQVLARKPSVVGIYKLAMKAGSDNFREAAVLDVMAQLEDAGVKLIVFDPNLEMELSQGHQVIGDLEQFKAEADLILANRFEDSLSDVQNKLLCRDIFGRD